MTKLFNPTPPQELLQELFIYSFVEGVLYWRERPSNSVNLTKPAGCKSQWYHIISVEGRMYRRSRLVWAIHYDDPGPLEVDHVNRDSMDDRIENLRLATRSQNARSQTMRQNNKSGFRGVYWNKARSKYQAQIRDPEGNRVYLGLFTSPEDAAAAYAEAARRYHGEFMGALT